MKLEFPWKKKRIKIKKVKDIANIAKRVYNDNDICFLSTPGCNEDIVIRRDDNISAEAVTNYYPQLGVYEIVLGKNKDGHFDETMHELSHIYRGHFREKQLNIGDFIRSEIEAWLDSSYLVYKNNKKRNILQNGQWLAGIGNKAMSKYKATPKRVIGVMKKVVDDMGDLTITDKEWRVIELVLKK